MQRTIYDVAKRARVSVTTVFRVLNNEDTSAREPGKKFIKLSKKLTINPTNLFALY
ncbi:LacI family DNA-binding transcriptional regulator [Paenibacillus sp. 203]|uniref:LacI family DNA-binding transcriptional regulator n=1 Tax=Paenibacillus sp. 203 TaxID=3096765 RepID=UPI003FA751EE